ALRSPRRAIAAHASRPAAGQTGQNSGYRTAHAIHPRARRAPLLPLSQGPPRVIAFVEPGVPGARASLAAHLDQIGIAAFTGLLAQRDGALVDRLDPSLLGLAQGR